MKILDITTESITLPDHKGKILIKKLFKHPLDVETAKNELLPLFNTPLLVDLLNSLDPGVDIRGDIVEYMNAEYPNISDDFRKLHMKRDDNIEGDLSPLGHKDES